MVASCTTTYMYISAYVLSSQPVREMLQEYARWVGLDLTFQYFAEEVAGLPGPTRVRLAHCLSRERRTLRSA